MGASVVGPWARDKLDRLEKYLSAYTTILKEQKWCHGFHYVDAFAGPGEHEIRRRTPSARQALLEVSSFGNTQQEQREFLAGSPRVALALKHPFSTYTFIEHSPTRIESLKLVKEEYGSDRRIQIHQGDCTKYLREQIAKNPKVDWHVHRAIVFLDPFGMQVGWQTIADLATTNAIEIFLNFPVGMAIQRLLPRQHEKLTSARRQQLDEYFGARGWEAAIYPRSRTLFDDEDAEKVEKSGRALLKWYRGQLKTVFRCVSKAALIRNTRGGHLYYLLLASHKQTAVRIANDILSAGEVV